MAYDYVLAVGGSAGSTLGGSSFGRPQRAAGSSCRRTLICCRKVQISASSITRDRIRSTTIQPMSLQRSLIPHDHRPILDRLPSRIRFATGTAGFIEKDDGQGGYNLTEMGLNSYGPMILMKVWGERWVVRDNRRNFDFVDRSGK